MVFQVPKQIIHQMHGLTFTMLSQQLKVETLVSSVKMKK